MNKHLLKTALGWGMTLWLCGYILGFVLFFLVPPAILGWVIMPFGIALTLWVLLKKIKNINFSDYLIMAGIWTLLAIIFDYLFIVKLLNPADGYYKLDVYLYYALTLALPVVVGWRKTMATQTS